MIETYDFIGFGTARRAVLRPRVLPGCQPAAPARWRRSPPSVSASPPARWAASSAATSATRSGASRVLVASLIVMGLATFVDPACLPTYAAIGILAPDPAGDGAHHLRASPSAPNGAARS